MLQNEYELVYIIRPDLDDAASTEVIERVETTVSDNGGTVLLREDWGNRKLAYPIRNHLKGHYVLVNFLSPAAVIAEVERRLRILDPVIRFLTVKKVEAVDVDLRTKQAAEQRRLREEEEARAKAEAARREAERAKDDDKQASA